MNIIDAAKQLISALSDIPQYCLPSRISDDMSALSKAIKDSERHGNAPSGSKHIVDMANALIADLNAVMIPHRIAAYTNALASTISA